MGADHGGISIDTGVRAAVGIGDVRVTWFVSLLTSSSLLLESVLLRDLGRWPFPNSCSFSRVSNATVR